jgi:hypothetical protein
MCQALFWVLVIYQGGDEGGRKGGEMKKKGTNCCLQGGYSLVVGDKSTKENI